MLKKDFDTNLFKSSMVLIALVHHASNVYVIVSNKVHKLQFKVIKIPTTKINKFPAHNIFTL